MDKLKPENLNFNNSWCNANVEILNIYVTFIKYNVSSQVLYLYDIFFLLKINQINITILKKKQGQQFNDFGKFLSANTL